MILLGLFTRIPGAKGVIEQRPRICLSSCAFHALKSPVSGGTYCAAEGQTEFGKKHSTLLDLCGVIPEYTSRFVQILCNWTAPNRDHISHRLLSMKFVLFGGQGGQRSQESFKAFFDYPAASG